VTPDGEAAFPPSFARQPHSDDPPMHTASADIHEPNATPARFVNSTKVVNLFRPHQLLCCPQLSPSAFTGGRALRAKATVLPEGCTEPVEICVGVDTMSDVNLALRHLLSDVSPVIPDDVRGTGSVMTFDEQGFLDVFRDGV
jgi:hypothetical protein